MKGSPGETALEMDEHKLILAYKNSKKEIIDTLGFRSIRFFCLVASLIKNIGTFLCSAAYSMLLLHTLQPY